MSDIKFKATLDTGDFDTKLSGAAKSLDKVGKESNGATKALASLKKAMIGIAAATTGLAAIAVTSARTGIELSKAARLAGTSVKDFQALAYAASTVGIEQEKLGDIFKDTQDKIGDFAQNGAGPLTDFFDNIGKKVGVTIQDFQGLSGPEALGLYIKTLEEAGVSQSEMIFYMEAMASDSANLTNLFANQGAELNRLTGTFDKLGLAMSGSDMEALATNAENIGLITSALSNMSLKIGVALEPALQSIADGFTKAMSAGSTFRNMFEGMLSRLEFLAKNLDKVGFVAAGLGVAFIALKVASMGAGKALIFFRGALIRTGIGALIVGAGELIYQFSELSDRVGGTSNAFVMLGNVASEVWQRIKEGGSLIVDGLKGDAMKIGATFQNLWVSILEGFSRILLKIQGGINNLKGAITNALTFTVPEVDLGPLGVFGGQTFEGPEFEGSTFGDDYAAGIDAKRAAADAATQAAQDFNSAVRESASNLLRPLESLNALKATTVETTVAATELSEAVATIGAGTGTGTGGADPVLTLRQNLDEWRESMKQGASAMSDMIQSSYGKMEDSLVSFAQTGKLNFKSLINSMAADLIRFSIRSAMFGGAGGGGILSSLFSAKGNAFGSSGQLNFADGGVFNQKFAMPMGDGRTAIGAESGPEAIMPLQRGKDGRLGVISAGGKQSGGGQIVNQFNTTVNPPPNSTPEDARAFAREFNRAVEAKVVETMSRVQKVGIGGRR